MAPQGSDCWGRRCRLCCRLRAPSVPCLVAATHHVLCFQGRAGPRYPSWVLTSLPSAFPVNGDAVGAADIEEERPATAVSVPTPTASSVADSSVAPALPALPSSGETEEAASGSSAPPARAAVPALDALPPG